MGRANTDHHLLFGILAFQNNFISRDQLLAAFNSWVLDKDRSLGEILVQQQVLSRDRQTLLEALVQEHLGQHDGDAEKSLAAVSSIQSVRRELADLADPDLQASFAHVAVGRDGETYATCPPTIGQPTSAGTRFMIVRPHAKGGLGEVYVARDRELNREVALKQIQSRHADNVDSRGRFLLEAEVTGGLEHPGIVPVYGLGSHPDGRPYYAMRFIRGESLQEAIGRFHSAIRNPQSPFDSLAFRKLLQRFVDVCNALQYAHDRGVLHRDLKPDNIMLGKYGETLVVDWGLAKTAVSRDAAPATEESPLHPASGSGSAATVMGAAIGTPAYMSPEQAAGRLDQLGPASDVYSLGATLYCLVTGRPPIDGKDAAEVLRKVQSGDFPSPKQRNAQVPAALQAICLRALALRPQDRYASPRAFANDLEHWLADEPVACYAEPLPVRAGRFARKHKALMATAAAVLLTSTVGLSAGLYFINAEKNETELARRGERYQRLAAQQAGQREHEQRIAADTSAQTAREREAETQAVLDFVEERIFAAARPEGQEGGLGHDVKLRQAIAAALPYMEGSFTNEPLIEARLRTTLGTSFWRLGEFNRAHEQYTKAHTLYLEHRGPDHADTLSSMHNLARGYMLLGRHAEALKLNEKTLALRKANLGPDHLDTIKTMINMAVNYSELGRHEEALMLREETLALQESNFGRDHSITQMCMTNLASTYAKLRRHAEALKIREEHLALQRSRLDAAHPETLASMINLASSYSALGREAEALRLREEAVELQKAKIGADHPGTLSSMNDLALSYAALGRHADALKLNEETLALRRARLSPDHVDTLRSMHNLARNYAALGRHSDALKLNEETLALRTSKLSPHHVETLSTMHELALSYAALGRHADALKLNEETLALRKATLGPGHRDTLSIMNSLAANYSALGRAEALKLHDETLNLRRAKLPPDDPDTLGSMHNVAREDAARPAR